jgi:hypothetical protein
MKLHALVLVAGFAFLPCTLAAQERAQPLRGPDGGTRTRVAGIEVLPVAGKPFSGRDTIEWTRNLEDGSVVTTHLSAAVARDSQGRIYRERRSFVPANSSEESRLIEIILLDPATQTRTTCDVTAHHCSITSYHASVSYTPAPTGPFANGTRYLSRESIGTKVVEDLDVVGTRETFSINAGVVGNSQPLVTTREFWYSPELQINLSVTRKDPREGTQDIQLVDISRAEPDPAFFEIPGDYVIQDLRGTARSDR